jgi:hypothetical protein
MLNELIIILAALAILILIICWVLKLIKLSITTALTVFGIIILLKFGFGIDSGMVWQAIINIPQTIYTLINN